MTDKRKKVILDLISSDFYVPMKEKELAVMLQVSKADRGELNRLLNELLAEGKLSLTKKGKFIKAKQRVDWYIYQSSKGFWLCRN